LPNVRDFDLANQARSFRRFASLLSTFSPLAGVTAKTSRSIKPRERDLRDLRLLFWSGFLRGQRTILDMPPALPTMSRSQCAPVSQTYDVEPSSASRSEAKPAGLNRWSYKVRHTRICERVR